MRRLTSLVAVAMSLKLSPLSAKILALKYALLVTRSTLVSKRFLILVVVLNASRNVLVCVLLAKHNTNAPRFSKKVLVISTFFVSAVFSLSLALASTLPAFHAYSSASASYVSAARLNCKPKGKQQALHQPKVIDGDTLYGNGQKIRLIGINTPELEYDNSPSEPFALAAKQAAKRWLEQYSEHLFFVKGKQQRDRYGRMLAYIVNEQGELLSKHLLLKGLGFYIAVPPNTELLPCFIAAEQRARNNRQNIWRELSPTTTGNVSQPGFQLVLGKVTSVIITDNHWWVILGKDIALKIQKADQPFFNVEWVKKLKNTTLEVRGWLIDRQRKRRKLPKHYAHWLMLVRHPAVIQLKKPSNRVY